MKYFYSPQQELESNIDKFFQYIREKNDQEFSGQISILLLGSLSRGEATWVIRNGHTELLSDIEFFAVYSQGFQAFNDFDQVVHDAAARNLVNIGTSLFHIDYSWVSLTQLRRIERKLITYDAQEMGITVIGKDVKKMLPHIDITNINMEDIKDILIHRVFSILSYRDRNKHEQNSTEYRYLLAKNSLDLMTVLLVEHGILVSGFENKLREVDKLSICQGIKGYFHYCLEVKLGLESNHDFKIEEMERIFVSVCEELAARFQIPIKNRVINFKAIIRRRMGMVKRSIRSKHIPSMRKKHFHHLMQIYKENEKMERKVLLDNWILNGYPAWPIENP